MSVVIAMKYKDGVVIGADRQATCGDNKVVGGVTKIKMFPYSKHAIGKCGYVRHTNALFTQEELVTFEDIVKQTEIDINYIVSVIMPNIRAVLKVFDEKEDIDDIGSTIYVTSDKIFTIESDGAVIENQNFACIGSGAVSANGLITQLYSVNDEEMLSEEDAITMVSAGIQTANENTIYVGDGIDIIVVKRNQEELDCEEPNATAEK